MHKQVKINHESGRNNFRNHQFINHSSVKTIVVIISLQSVLSLQSQHFFSRLVKLTRNIPDPLNSDQPFTETKTPKLKSH